MNCKNLLFLLLISLGSVSISNAATIQEKRLDLFDQNRKRQIPVEIYVSNEFKEQAKAGKMKLPIAIINHGYRIRNTEYSFIANNLAAAGYLVISIQHELPTDGRLPQASSVYERRKPIWERGAQNILFVLKSFGDPRISPTIEAPRIWDDYIQLDFTKLILIGHSTGGDIGMLFAGQYPALASKIISLDNTRMFFPRSGKSPILLFRTNNTVLDEDVLPEAEERIKLGIKVVMIWKAKHIDLCDRGPEAIKQEVNEVIMQFLQEIS